MRILMAGMMLLAFAGCKTIKSDDQLSSVKSDDEEFRALPSHAQTLWDEYVKEETTSATLQEKCVPLQLRPSKSVDEKGLLVIYHGFSGCPNQFINIGRKLAAQGYHVLMPLLPGQGRVPLKIDRENGTVKDDNTAMPRNVEGYRNLTRKINQIAGHYPGYKVIAGLSGGGAQATGTAVAGYDPETDKNIWDRALLMVPLYKIPGLQGTAADIVNMSIPTFNAGFGNGCEASQLDAKEPRAGLCDFEVVHVQAMESYGRESAAQADKFKIPVQILGVEGDGAADDGAITSFFKRAASKDKSLCFYAKGVEHAMLYDGDYLHPDTRPWVPDVEAAVLNWITAGTHAETDGISKEHGQPRCKLTVALPQSS
jgi:esterase/lipase